MTKLSWNKLLTTGRIGTNSDEDARNAFQRDFDRIIFSSAFKRLQSKTQVFPLPEADFIHTRMTHSLEAGCVGRSLGYLVWKKLNENAIDIGSSTWTDFEGAVSAACLCHDIGNPPFGHSGETAIAEYFLKHRTDFMSLEGITDDNFKDFLYFDGNAMGFNILTHTLVNRSSRPGGMGLTAGVIAAFIKYPWFSSEAPLKKGKFSCFRNDEIYFKDAMTSCGLAEESKILRHPLSFLVEASDDICYKIMDLEDAYRLGIIPFFQLEELFMSTIGTSSSPSNYRLIIDEKEKAAYLRAKTISVLIDQLSDCFIENYNEIMDGTYSKALTSVIPCSDALSVIQKIEIDKVYSFRKVIEIETAGFEVIHGLLEVFIDAILNNSHRSKKIRKLIPASYMYSDDERIDRYMDILYIIRYIAGMTDKFAIETFRTMRGITLPSY
ncbi:dNTP triphosphohydrolase [Myxococcota bacterium]|nr:dNTP triphosphohydrolase [Myxococcota bacterium]MBU1381756.1 dNTP triphosphohydrolase [Myxococcota bacterium]MBU1496405.1 dNTP triphosphohydrolase [Myxococcota bacterium]